jgi:hypothetical protein
LIITNLFMVAVQGALIVSGSDGYDFATYHAAVERLAIGTLYSPAEPWYDWRYSPVMVFPLALVTWIGQEGWRALHFVALIGLPGWARLIALASYPFWFDVAAGNILTFVLVAAYWALRGSRFATGSTLALSLLVPRPMMLPVVVWLLWKQRGWRVPFVAMVLIHGAAVIATGYGSEWIAKLTTVTGAELVPFSTNVAPSAIVGLWWLVAAIPLSAWLFTRGYPASAGLMLQPYWLPYYLLLPLSDRWPITFRRQSRPRPDSRR